MSQNIKRASFREHYGPYFRDNYRSRMYSTANKTNEPWTKFNQLLLHSLHFIFGPISLLSRNQFRRLLKWTMTVWMLSLLRSHVLVSQWLLLTSGSEIGSIVDWFTLRMWCNLLTLDLLETVVLPFIFKIKLFIKIKAKFELNSE